MTTNQRRISSRTVLDTTETLDNDATSLSSQVDKAISDFTDSSTDDCVARTNLIEVLSIYVGEYNELSKLGGYSWNRKLFEKQIQLLQIGSINLGEYIAGGTTTYVNEAIGLYDLYLKKYREGDRTKKFKNGDFFDNENTMTGEEGSEFYPNLYPFLYLKREDLAKTYQEVLDSYRSILNNISSGINGPTKSNYIEINSKDKTYSANYTSSGSTSNYTGNLTGMICYAYTQDFSQKILVEIASGEAKINTSVVGTQGGSYVTYTYNFRATFKPLEDVPYYTEIETYRENGVNKTREVKKYYKFFPYVKNDSVTSDMYYRMMNVMAKKIVNVLTEVSQYNEDIKLRYKKYINIYNTTFNSSNQSMFFSNLSSLMNFLNLRVSECLKDFRDTALSSKLNSLYESRMNKDQGTLKQWYDGVTSIDESKKKFDKKVQNNKGAFNSLLVQQPIIDFEGGKEMTIDTRCSQYYSVAIGRYPTFNVGDTVYIMDDNCCETCCKIIKKETVQVEDTAEVKYKTVTKEDGTTEKVAETDSNGEPITIYTYKSATKLTFNGNIPAIYDTDSLRIIKEL